MARTDRESRRVAAIVPAYNEKSYVDRAIEALLAVPEIDLVLVVDDGSSDKTAQVAAAVVSPRVQLSRLSRNRGKGAALNHGMRVLVSESMDIFVFCDADLGDSAREIRRLLLPVLSGRADLATAVLPGSGSGGGFGMVVGLARLAIRLLTGVQLQAPLSGQRAFTAEVWRAAGPCASGYAVETVMTARVLRAGFDMVEVPTRMTHRITDNSPGGVWHRTRQLLDVVRGVTHLLMEIFLDFIAAGQSDERELHR